MRDPFEQVTVKSRKAAFYVLAATIALFAYALLFPTQVAIVAVILTLPFIIMLHEAAHFFAAKRSGMKVTEFFVGFGPRLWSFTRGETEYGVKAVILGGYCRIIGMTNLEEVAPEDEERAYRSKGYVQRVFVAFAGPAVHFFIAFVGFGPRIWSFTRGETEYGIKAVVLGGYCRIIGMTNLEEVAPEDEERAYRSKGYVQRVFVAFAGPAVHFFIAFVLMFAILFVAGDLRNERALTKLDAVQLGAKEAGLRAGDTILSIDETPITKWEQVSGVIVKHKAGDEIQIVVDRDGQRIAKNVELTGQVVEGQRAVLAGISATVVVPHPGFFKSLALAPGGVISIGHEAVDALGQIFSPSGISKYMQVLTGSDKSQAANQQRFLSPVGFAQVASHAVSAGWVAVAGLLLVINVFLGLVNLVPLLPFDGGHIAIATYEQIASAVTRRRVRVDAAKLMPIAGAVLVVLMFILVSSLFLDITHPVANPF